MIAALAVTWLVVLGAQAQTRSALSWVREPGAEQCIAAPELGQRVQTLSGRDLVAAPEAQVSIEGRIARASAKGFVATISVSDRRGSLLGSRELRSPEPDCRALDDRLAFVIAVALDPNSALLSLPGELSDDEQPEAAALAELRAQPPAPARASATSPAAEPARDRPPPAQPPARARRGEPFVLGGLAAIAARAGNPLGHDPLLAPGVLVQGGVTVDGWPLLARFGWWASDTREIEPGADIDLSLLELGVLGCVPFWHADRNPVAFELCAGGLATRLSADPRGWSGTARSTWAWGPELMARIAMRLSGPLFLSIAPTLSARFPHKRFGVEGGGTQRVYNVPPFAGAVATGLELRW